ncbi:MAG: GNAT family N-acetyltransferase [Bdellovibrionaceae bacterium]|nr:GNAT family N-acetyltransferase [Pseudobdellovibrionaceae bacterium]
MTLPEIDRNKLQIRTRRLVLRPLQFGDYAAWVEANRQAKPSQNRFDSGTSPESTSTKVILKKMLRSENVLWIKDRHYSLAIFEKKTGALVGSVQVLPHVRMVFQTAAIGYTIKNNHWRKGYASEAVRALTLFAFKKLKFHRLTAEIELENKASIRLAKKMGFRKEGRILRAIYFNKKWNDMELYAVTAEDLGFPKSPPVFRTRLQEY